MDENKKWCDILCDDGWYAEDVDENIITLAIPV